LHIHFNNYLGAGYVINRLRIKHNRVEKKGSFFFDTRRGEKQVFCKMIIFDKKDRKKLINHAFKKKRSLFFIISFLL